jgi:hypothetical protein
MDRRTAVILCRASELLSGARLSGLKGSISELSFACELFSYGLRLRGSDRSISDGTEAAI